MTKLLYRMVICAIAGEDDRLKGLYDIYTKESRLHVSIGEMVGYRQPEVCSALTYAAEAEDMLAAACLTDHQRRIARIMQEPPRPGRGA